MIVARTTNLLVRSFFVFIIAYLWIGFYVRGFFETMILATLVTLIVNFVVAKLTANRSANAFTSKQQIEHMKLVILQMQIMSKQQMEKLISAVTDEKISVGDFRPELIYFAKSTDTKLYTYEQFYLKYLLPNKTFPKIYGCTKPKKVTWRDIRDYATQKHRVKPYVITAVVILFTSMIVQLSIYYIIVATLLFGLALYSHVKKEKVPADF